MPGPQNGNLTAPGVPSGPKIETPPSVVNNPTQIATVTAPEVPSGPKIETSPSVVNTQRFDTNPPPPGVATNHVAINIPTNAPPMNPVRKAPDSTPEVKKAEGQTNTGVTMATKENEKQNEDKKENEKKENLKKKEEKIPQRNNTLKPVHIDDSIQTAPPSSFSPMVPIEQTVDGKGLANLMVIGSEIIHVTHPGQRFRSQGGFNVLYIGSSEKELRDLYGVTTDAQLCAMQRAFGVRYMHQKPEIETSNPPCAVQDKAIILQALKKRLSTLSHQLSLVPDNLVKARYLVQRKYLQDLVKKIESTPGDAKPCPIVERHEVNTQMPDMKGLFSGLTSKSSDCLQNMQLLQQLMMIMMLLLGSVSDKDIQNYLDQIPLEKILEIARSPKPSSSNLDIIQGAIDSLYMIYMKRQQKGPGMGANSQNMRADENHEQLRRRIDLLTQELETLKADRETLAKFSNERVAQREDYIHALQQQLQQSQPPAPLPSTGPDPAAQQAIQERDARIRVLEAELETARIPAGPDPETQRILRERGELIDRLEAELETARQQLQEQINGINNGNGPEMGIQDLLPVELKRDIFQQVSEQERCLQAPDESQERPLDYFEKIEITGDGACLYSSIYYAYIHHLSLKYPENVEYRTLVNEARTKSSHIPPQTSKIRTDELQGYFDILDTIFEETSAMRFCHGTGKIRYEDIYDFNPRPANHPPGNKPFDDFMSDTFTIENGVPKEYGYADIHGFMIALQSQFHVRVYEISRTQDKYNLVYSTEINNIPNIKGYLNILKDTTEYNIPGKKMNNNLKANLGLTNEQAKEMSSGISGSVDHYHVLFPRQLEEIEEAIEGESEEVVQIRNIYTQLLPLFQRVDDIRGELVDISRITLPILLDYIQLYTVFIQSQGDIVTRSASQQGNITRLQGELREARAQATTNLGTRNSRIAELEGELREARTQATSATSIVGARNSRITELEEELREARTQASSATTTLGDRNTTIERLTRELEEARTQASSATTTLGDRNTTIERLTRELEEATSQATTTIRSRNNTIASLRQQLQEATAQGSSQTANITKLRSDLETAQKTANDELAESNRQLSKVRANLLQAEAEATAAKTNRNTKQATINTQLEQLETARRRIEELQKGVTNIESILGILLTDRDLRERAIAYGKGTDDTEIEQLLGNHMRGYTSNNEVCAIYNTLYNFFKAQEKFLFSNIPCPSLGENVFSTYFNYDFSQGKDYHLRIIKDIIKLIQNVSTIDDSKFKDRDILEIPNIPNVSSLITVRLIEDLQRTPPSGYVKFISQLRAIYTGHKFMKYYIHFSDTPNSVRVSKILRGDQINYIPILFLYIQLIQLIIPYGEKCPTMPLEDSDPFCLTGSPAPTANVPPPRAADVRSLPSSTSGTMRVRAPSGSVSFNPSVSPRSSSPTPMERRGSVGSSSLLDKTYKEAWDKANPYVDPKSASQIFSRR
jgi:DNA repair exonuclease SbcCD ATPase subunit